MIDLQITVHTQSRYICPVKQAHHSSKRDSGFLNSYFMWLVSYLNRTKRWVFNNSQFRYFLFKCYFYRSIWQYINISFNFSVPPLVIVKLILKCMVQWSTRGIYVIINGLSPSGLFHRHFTTLFRSGRVR